MERYKGMETGQAIPNRYQIVSRVTSLEWTVIDSIADFEKIGGLEELLRCLLLIPSLDCNKLLDALELYGRAQLYQKAGYILESWKEELSLPEPFFCGMRKTVFCQ